MPSARMVTIDAGVPLWRPAPIIVNVKLPEGREKGDSAHENLIGASAAPA